MLLQLFNVGIAIDSFTEIHLLSPLVCGMQVLVMLPTSHYPIIAIAAAGPLATEGILDDKPYDTTLHVLSIVSHVAHYSISLVNLRLTIFLTFLLNKLWIQMQTMCTLPPNLLLWKTHLPLSMMLAISFMCHIILVRLGFRAIIVDALLPLLVYGNLPILVQIFVSRIIFSFWSILNPFLHLQLELLLITTLMLILK